MAKTRSGGATATADDVAKKKRAREDRVLFVVGINVTLYAVCYQLQRPIEPYLVDRLGADRPGSDAAASYAKLQSFFSLIQTVGSPVVGLLLVGLALFFSRTFCRRQKPLDGGQYGPRNSRSGPRNQSDTSGSDSRHGPRNHTDTCRE